DGTTGSYILFDKTTLQPLAVVNQAGQQTNISNGVISQSSEPLSPEIQKLITDVFSLKFSDLNNNKTTTAQTDSTNPLLLEPIIKLASGTIDLPEFSVNVKSSSSAPPSPTVLPFLFSHPANIDTPPTVVVTGSSLNVHSGAAIDTTSGTILF